MSASAFSAFVAKVRSDFAPPAVQGTVLPLKFPGTGRSNIHNECLLSRSLVWRPKETPNKYQNNVNHSYVMRSDGEF